MTFIDDLSEQSSWSDVLTCIKKYCVEFLVPTNFWLTGK